MKQVTNAMMFELSKSIAMTELKAKQQGVRFAIFMPSSQHWLGANNHWVQDQKHALTFNTYEAAEHASKGYLVIIQEVK